MEDNKNQPAFPVLELKHIGDKLLLDCTATGVNKREMFAMAAMQGILSNHWCQNDFKNNIVAIGPSEVALQAVGYADALLAELSKA